jgi:leucine-zipper of insertion element IS481
MRLHRRARSCPNSRLLLCRRVLEQGWSLKAAAEAAGFSERTGPQVAFPLPHGGRGGADRPLLGPPGGAQPHPRGPRPGDRRTEATALHRTGDRRGAFDGHLDRLGGAKTDQARQAQPSRAARAAAHRRQEAGADRAPWGGPSGHWEAAAPQPEAGRRLRHAPVAGRLGVCPRLRRRRHPACLRRGPSERAGDYGGRLPAPGADLLPRHVWGWSG